MTRDDFNEQYARLIDAFGAERRKERAGIYFKELKGIDWREFTQSVDRWVRQEKKFPTIADLLQLHGANQPASGFKELPSRGDIGMAWRQTDIEEFRNKVVNKAIEKDPELFVRGFKKTAWVVKKHHPEKYEAACEALSDLVGKKRFDQIMAGL